MALRVSVTAGPGLVKSVGFVGRSKPVSRTVEALATDHLSLCRPRGRPTVRLVVQPDAPHDWHVSRRQGTQQLSNIILLAGVFCLEYVRAFEDFDPQLSRRGELVQIRVVFWLDGFAVLDGAVARRLIADEAIPWRVLGHSGNGAGKSCLQQSCWIHVLGTANLLGSEDPATYPKATRLVWRMIVD
jgi:hypothetical protein